MRHLPVSGDGAHRYETASTISAPPVTGGSRASLRQDDARFLRRLVLELLCHALRAFGVEARAGRQPLPVEVADNRHHLRAPVESEALRALDVEPTRDLP